MLNGPKKTPAIPRVEDKTLALLAVYGEDKKGAMKWYKDTKKVILENEKLIGDAANAVRDANKKIVEAQREQDAAQKAWDESSADLDKRSAALTASKSAFEAMSAKQKAENKAALEDISTRNAEIATAAAIVAQHKENADKEDTRQEKYRVAITLREKALGDGERRLNAFWRDIRNLMPRE